MCCLKKSCLTRPMFSTLLQLQMLERRADMSYTQVEDGNTKRLIKKLLATITLLRLLSPGCKTLSLCFESIFTVQGVICFQYWTLIVLILVYFVQTVLFPARFTSSVHYADFQFTRYLAKAAETYLCCSTADLKTENLKGSFCQP